jgi:hypothetical protein
MMFFLITNSDLLTLRLKTINYSVSNGKGTVGSYNRICLFMSTKATGLDSPEFI